MSKRTWGRGGVVAVSMGVIGLVAAGAAWLVRGSLPGLTYLDRVPATKWRVCQCAPDTLLTYHRPDGLAVRARVYRPDTGEARGGVLLFHGNTIKGGDRGLYRVLGRKLAAAGYLVLAPDLGGYGLSGDPLELGSVGALDLSHDTRAAVNELIRLDSEATPIYAIGHSATGVPALQLALADERVAGGVAIGPERKSPERKGNPAVVHGFWERVVQRYDALYHRRIPDWYTESDFRRSSLRNTLERLFPQLSTRRHAPVLIVEGAREDPRDLEFTRDFLDRLPSGMGTGHLVVPDAFHYMNVMGTCTLNVCVYDDRTVPMLVHELVEWFDTAS